MTNQTKTSNNKIALLIICAIFFVFGFATWINAMLIPYFKIACQLSNYESYLVAFAFYIAYLVVAVPASYLLKNTGYKKGMMIGFFTMAIGAFLFVPAAYYRTYGIFLTGLFLIGIGLAILQTAANPYVTILGERERAAQRISIMGICNKTAGIIAPLLLASIIIKPTDKQLFKDLLTMSPVIKTHVLDALIRRVIPPYAVVGCVLTSLGIFIRYAPLPEIEEDTTDTTTKPSGSIFQYPHLILGAVAIFLHVGSQVIAIDTIINYAGDMGIPITDAKVLPSFILFSTICGYLFGISVIPKTLSQLTALRICTVLGIILTALIVGCRMQVKILGHHADISLWFMVCLGFANSMIWAGIWPLALDGLNKHLKLGASILVMGLCGNAILPLIYGHYADKYSMRQAYWILMPCYIYLSFYAFYGYRIRRWIFSK